MNTSSSVEPHSGLLMEDEVPSSDFPPASQLDLAATMVASPHAAAAPSSSTGPAIPPVSLEPAGGPKLSLVGVNFRGLIDGTFEHGYFITVVADNKVYRGMLFEEACGVETYRLPKQPHSSDAKRRRAGRPSTSKPSALISPHSLANSSSHPVSSMMALPSSSESHGFLSPAPFSNPASTSSLAPAFDSTSQHMFDSHHFSNIDDIAAAGLLSSNGDDDTDGDGDDDNLDGMYGGSQVMGNSIYGYSGSGAGGNNSSSTSSSAGGSGRKRPVKALSRTMAKKLRDPNAPALPQTGYLYYQAHARTELQKSHPSLHYQEISSMIGAAWKNMSNDDRKPWLELAEQDRQRYERESAVYIERLAAVGMTPESAQQAYLQQLNSAGSGRRQSSGAVTKREASEPVPLTSTSATPIPPITSLVELSRMYDNTASSSSSSSSSNTIAASSLAAAVAAATAASLRLPSAPLPSESSFPASSSSPSSASTAPSGLLSLPSLLSTPASSSSS